MSTDYVMAPSVTLVAAQRVVAAAIEKAGEVGIAVCVAVVDPGGNLLTMSRMDRAALLCIRIAQDKAYSVAAFGGMATGNWWGAIEADPALVHGLPQTERLTIFGGGVPLVADGQVIGAVGVSGGSVAQDVTIAEAGAAALT